MGRLCLMPQAHVHLSQTLHDVRTLPMLDCLMDTFMMCDQELPPPHVQDMCGSLAPQVAIHAMTKHVVQVQ